MYYCFCFKKWYEVIWILTYIVDRFLQNNLMLYYMFYEVSRSSISFMTYIAGIWTTKIIKKMIYFICLEVYWIVYNFLFVFSPIFELLLFVKKAMVFKLQSTWNNNSNSLVYATEKIAFMIVLPNLGCGYKDMCLVYC